MAKKSKSEIRKLFNEVIEKEQELQIEIAPILLTDLTKLFSMYVDNKKISLISIAAVSEAISRKMKNDGIEMWQKQFESPDSEMLKVEKL